MCVREAEFFGNTDPNVIPPVVIVNDQKLTREEIIDQVAEKYGDKVSKAHAFLLDNFNSDVKDL